MMVPKLIMSWPTALPVTSLPFVHIHLTSGLKHRFFSLLHFILSEHTHYYSWLRLFGSLFCHLTQKISLLASSAGLPLPACHLHLWPIYDNYWIEQDFKRAFSVRKSNHHWKQPKDHSSLWTLTSTRLNTKHVHQCWLDDQVIWQSKTSATILFWQPSFWSIVP